MAFAPHEVDSALRRLAIQAIAAVVLLGLAILSLCELAELRGELAFARFLSNGQWVDAEQDPDLLFGAIQEAGGEADLIFSFGRGNPEALVRVAQDYLRWAGRKELSPQTRLELSEKAVEFALLAVRTAPSDYEPWLWLARALLNHGQEQQAALCLKRAQELAPPGMKLRIIQT